ncbi:hypothetical protein K505DRAFT_333625 [Melanomma pulvis-pyrius CBS 109.77]|uniref:Uncharacterized protein n=1 Tax=Melanomma pulvis-pyrius CBS 109.77 TaxID=1314802 RepID=A0A6A6XQG4_9PLEO|nr:hypothetical protein K505DRAFT_333625 [Melanomma pulvis-pyrius CBS 109.77]
MHAIILFLLAFGSTAIGFALTFTMMGFVLARLESLIAHLAVERSAHKSLFVQRPSSDNHGSKSRLPLKRQVKKRYARRSISGSPFPPLLEVPTGGTNCVVM